MKWRCSLFFVMVGAISFVGGCCAHPQPKTVAVAQKPPAPQAQPAPVTPPPPVMPPTHLTQVPPPVALQVPPQAAVAAPQPPLETFLAFDQGEKDVNVPYGTAAA